LVIDTELSDGESFLTKAFFLDPLLRAGHSAAFPLLPSDPRYGLKTPPRALRLYGRLELSVDSRHLSGLPFAPSTPGSRIPHSSWTIAERSTPPPTITPTFFCLLAPRIPEGERQRSYLSTTSSGPYSASFVQFAPAS